MRPTQRPGKNGSKRARNREERTEALLDAGRKLFLERGIEAVSIDELAKEAGMAKGNFYRYFADKGALVDALLAPIAGEIRRAMRKCAVSLARAESSRDVSSAYAQLALALAGAALPRVDLVQLYLQENRAPVTPARAGVHGLSRELSEGAVHLTEVAISHGLLRVSDPRVSALAVVGAIEQLAIATLRHELRAPADRIAQVVVSMVLDGIRSR